MSDIIIRIAIPEDAKAINTITYKGWIKSPDYQKIFGHHIQEAKKGLTSKSIKERLSQIQHKRDDELSLIAEIDKKAVGICYGCLSIKSESLQFIKDYEKYAELKGLYIDPDYQGKGIGGKLLQEFEKRISSQGKNKCVIKTLAQNKQSNGFYKKQGYIDTNTTCHFTRRDITTTCTIYTKEF